MNTRAQIKMMLNDPEEGINVQEYLDREVDDAVSEIASNINNSGLNAQLDFLNKHGLTDKEILDNLKESMG